MARAAARRRASPTLDGLIRSIDAQPLIVHVAESDDATALFDDRYLRVKLRRLAPVVAAAVLAHALQHALEIAAAGVSTRAEFEALYRRIGVATAHADDAHFDTPAAVAAGQMAIRALTRRPVCRLRLTTP